MAGRNLLPIIMLGGLSATAASAGIGYGLGQYTVSGINPFYTIARTTPQYRHEDKWPATELAFYDPASSFVPPTVD